MTLAEVETVLEVPAGNHTRYITYAGGPLDRKNDHIEWWEWDDGRLKVTFDESGRVCEQSYYPTRDAPTALDRLWYQLSW